MDGASAPSSHAGQGLACVAWLDHELLGRPFTLAPPAAATLGWLQEAVLARAQGPLLGLACDDLDEARFAALRSAGAALARGGALRWGHDVREHIALSAPTILDQHLQLPPPEVLFGCNGVQLKPLRAWFGQRLGLRLQAAPRIACYLWSNQALLVSCRQERLGGFLHGPGPGQRHPLTWEPNQPLWLRW